MLLAVCFSNQINSEDPWDDYYVDRYLQHLSPCRQIAVLDGCKRINGDKWQPSLFTFAQDIFTA